MILDATKEFINKAIECEIQNAVQSHGEKYSTSHEAWAILKEEIEEASDELEKVETLSKIMWNAIKQDNNKWQKSHLDAMREYALNLIAETCQVIAVVDKFQKTLEGKK